jgi:hypothetical protein
LQALLLAFISNASVSAIYTAVLALLFIFYIAYDFYQTPNYLSNSLNAFYSTILGGYASLTLCILIFSFSDTVFETLDFFAAAIVLIPLGMRIGQMLFAKKI